MSDRLIPGLRSALSNGPPAARAMPLPPAAEETMMRSLDHFGEKVRDLLTPQQVDTFRQFRESGKVSAVSVRVYAGKSGADPTFFEVLYTAFGETGPSRQPITQTEHQEGDKTVTKTDVEVTESHGNAKILAQIHDAAEAVEALGAKDREVQNYAALWLLTVAKVDPSQPASGSGLATAVDRSSACRHNGHQRSSARQIVRGPAGPRPRLGRLLPLGRPRASARTGAVGTTAQGGARHRDNCIDGAGTAGCQSGGGTCAPGGATTSFSALRRSRRSRH